MNNLNVPMQNTSPNEREGSGDGSKWNYALLVPMLGLAAYRWYGSRESRKKIEQVRAECKYEIETAKKELKLKHQDVINHYELEQEKLKSEVQSCHNNLLAQKRQLVENHRQQEQGRINSEKAEWQSQARALVEELEKSLSDRQHLYCSNWVRQTVRLELEEKMLSQAVTNPVAKELGIEDNLKYIFKYETHCANKLNSDKKHNGRLMWVFLKSWGDRIELQKLKKFKKMELGEKGT